MVTAGRRHLERQPRHRLAAHISQIVADDRRVDRRRRHRRINRLPQGATGQHIDQLGQRRHASHLSHRHRRGLTHRGRRHHPLELGSNTHHRRHPGHRAKRTVEAELTREPPTPERLGVDLLGGRQHADRDREIEARATLAMGRRSQIDRHPTIRPGQAAREHRGSHPITGLTTGLIGEAEHGERGQPRTHMHLDPHPMATGTEHRGRMDTGDHERPPTRHRATSAPDHGRRTPRSTTNLDRGCDGDPGPATAHGTLAPMRHLALTLVAIGAACGGGNSNSDPVAFCDALSASLDLVRNPVITTEAEIDQTLLTYRRLGDLAPLDIADDWAVLVTNVETAAAVVPNDRDSIQRAVQQAYASERSAVAVARWVNDRCGYDMGPVTTIAPHDTPTPAEPPGVTDD